MATYKEIQFDVKQNSGFLPKTCWIADMKEKCGLPRKNAWNRQGRNRSFPCPPEKEQAIRESFRRLKMI